ncbi:MAG: hypothetical protein V1720_04280 [bacterium]
MPEISIPVPSFKENQVAEVELTINGKKKKYNFRIESFKWIAEKQQANNLSDATGNKIQKLKSFIEDYDEDWEIVQIYAPPEKSEFIQVLFRKKISAKEKL